MKRLLTSLAIAATLSASAQTEPLDTVTIPGRTIVSPSAPIQPSESTTLDITNTEISAPYTSPWYLRYAIANLGLYDVMPTTAGTVADWGTGSVSGMADTRTMPGMMAVNNGGFAVTQTVVRSALRALPRPSNTAVLWVYAPLTGLAERLHIISPTDSVSPPSGHITPAPAICLLQWPGT